MDTPIRLPKDFREFLRLLSENDVRYLLVGGYAVGLYGYPRPTGDIDVWVSRNKDNALKLVNVLAQFGFASDELDPELFKKEKSIVRMGVAPFKIEVITFIDGVIFEDCYPRRLETELDGCTVHVIGFDDLLKNKKASGRPKDLDDLIVLTETG